MQQRNNGVIWVLGLMLSATGCDNNGQQPSSPFFGDEDPEGATTNQAAGASDTSPEGDCDTHDEEDASSSTGPGEGDEPDDASPLEGTKFNPGHYVFMSISRGHDIEERNRLRLEFIERYIDDPHIKGFIGSYDWQYLEPEKDAYDFDNIEEILERLEGTGKHFGVYLKDRTFNSDCTKPPVPDYLQTAEYGGTYKYNGYVCMVKLYREDVMDRHIALFRALGQAFDDHPNFEIVSTGETSIGGDDDYSHDAWAQQLIRFFDEAKQDLPHTIVNIQTNFLGGGIGHIEQIAEAMAERGGGALGLPDTVPCRRMDIPEEEVCGYRIEAYDVLRAYGGRLAIAPDVETWDLLFEQTPEVFDMAVDYLGATHVLWQSDFSSRRDERGHVPGYLDEQVRPTLEANDGRINDACPSELAPCE